MEHLISEGEFCTGIWHAREMLKIQNMYVRLTIRPVSVHIMHLSCNVPIYFGFYNS